MSYGALAKDEHARIAVEKALKGMRADTRGSVLLFLTTGYAQNPKNAIKEAAKAAGTPQVFGCCATGLINQDEWLLDAEGAVAMVFPPSHRLQAAKVVAQQGIRSNLLMTLSSPNAATIAVNMKTIDQFGSICSDDFGHGPYSLWQSGQIEANEYMHLTFPNERQHHVQVSEGISRLSSTMQINRSENHALIEVNGEPANANLLNSLPDNLHSIGEQHPYNLLCAVSENNSIESIQQGHYRLHHVVSTDTKSGKIHLSGSVKSGQYLFWAIRDEQHAQNMILDKLIETKNQLSSPPEFALMFPNIGRGPEFYNGHDRDLDAFKKVFPNTPLIGFYGNGEIAPGHKLAGLIHHYATVFAVYS